MWVFCGIFTSDVGEFFDLYFWKLYQKYFDLKRFEHEIYKLRIYNQASMGFDPRIWNVNIPKLSAIMLYLIRNPTKKEAHPIKESIQQFLKIKIKITLKYKIHSSLQ